MNTQSLESREQGIQIISAQSRSERERFVQFPWKIYNGPYGKDPLWVPPLLIERREFINPRKHPFYKIGSAEKFLAVRNGEDVGRILVSDDPSYNAFQKTNLGCFGMFETVDDPAVSRALLDTAASWLRQRGRDQIMGPIDYSMNYACGLLVDGFDTPPRLMMNHNPRYYEKHLFDWGLAKAKDLYAWWFVRNTMIEAWRYRVEKLAAHFEISIRPFVIKNWEQEAATAGELYEKSWHDNWGFVPMTRDEFRFMAREIVNWGVPSMLLMAEHKGKPVGFSMSMPDLNEALRVIDGRMFRWGLPLNYFRFTKAIKKIEHIRLLGLGVHPDYRRRGIAESLILRTFDEGMNRLTYKGAELSWTLEDNMLINRTIEAVGAKRYKTYRIYEKRI
jgi:GNAT superfamily N-acetyltransferase